MRNATVKLSDFDTKVVTSDNVPRNSSQREIPDRYPSPDSTAFQLDNKFVTIGTPKRKRANNMSINSKNIANPNKKKRFSASGGGLNIPGLNMGGRRGSRRNSNLHMRLNNKITPIMIGKLSPFSNCYRQSDFNRRAEEKQTE
jgi:hypothetical protein